MDKTTGDVLDEKPRNPKESLFAHGGMRCILVRGAILTVSVLIAYIAAFWLNGAYSFAEIKAIAEASPDVLHQAQTMAFTTLAFGELFHMFAMRNTEKSSFTVFGSGNVMMFAAFFVGIALQFAVIEIPALQMIFNTANLSGFEWLITAICSLLPLIWQEATALYKAIKKRVHKA